MRCNLTLEKEGLRVKGGIEASVRGVAIESRFDAQALIAVFLVEADRRWISDVDVKEYLDGSGEMAEAFDFGQHQAGDSPAPEGGGYVEGVDIGVEGAAGTLELGDEEADDFIVFGGDPGDGGGALGRGAELLPGEAEGFGEADAVELVEGFRVGRGVGAEEDIAHRLPPAVAGAASIAVELQGHTGVGAGDTVQRGISRVGAELQRRQRHGMRKTRPVLKSRTREALKLVLYPKLALLMVLTPP